MAEALHDRRRVPWLTDAIAVERSARQRLRHQWRRQDDDFDVAFGVDAAGCQPIAQFIVVARIGMDHGEARPSLRNRSDGRRKGRAIRGCVQGLAGAMIEHPRPERVRHRDGVAAEPQRHRRDRARGQRGEVEIAGDRHRRQHMRDLEMTDREPVTDIRPRAFARELERHPLVFREPLAFATTTIALSSSGMKPAVISCALSWPSWAEQARRGDEALGDLGELAVLVHRRLAHEAISLLFAQIARAHEMPLARSMSLRPSSSPRASSSSRVSLA